MRSSRAMKNPTSTHRLWLSVFSQCTTFLETSHYISAGRFSLFKRLTLLFSWKKTAPDMWPDRGAPSDDCCAWLPTTKMTFCWHEKTNAIKPKRRTHPAFMLEWHRPVWDTEEQNQSGGPSCLRMFAPLTFLPRLSIVKPLGNGNRHLLLLLPGWPWPTSPTITPPGCQNGPPGGRITLTDKS